MIGVDIGAIETTEDREKFRLKMQEIGVGVCKGQNSDFLSPGKGNCSGNRFPFGDQTFIHTLGGSGGGFVNTAEEFEKALDNGLHTSPIHEVLIEQSILGWKEYEVRAASRQQWQCDHHLLHRKL
jgi:carbamoyl-phosphate synthase large subunit